MPALPSVPQVFRVKQELVNNTTGRPTSVREFWHYTGSAPSNSDAVALATALQSAWGSHLKALFDPSWSLDTVSITDLTSPTAAVGIGTSGVQAGTRTGGPLPDDTAALLNMAIGRRYRGGHPRMYYPIGTQSDISTDQQWVPASVTAFETGINAWRAVIAGASFGSATVTGPVNVSYYEGFTVHTGTTGRARNVPTPRTSAVVDSVTAVSVAPFFAVQRKRRGKV